MFVDLKFRFDLFVMKRILIATIAKFKRQTTLKVFLFRMRNISCYFVCRMRMHSAQPISLLESFFKVIEITLVFLRTQNEPVVAEPLINIFILVFCLRCPVVGTYRSL